MATNFEKTIELMVQSGIRFVIIGDVSRSVHTHRYATDDIDFSYSRDPDGFPGLVETLNRHHVRLRNVPPELPFFFDLRILKNTQNFTLETDVGDMDLLAEPAGVDSFEGLWNMATKMEIFGMKVRVASIDDLIAMKRAAGRPKDRQHILELLDLQQFLHDEVERAGKESE